MDGLPLDTNQAADWNSLCLNFTRADFNKHVHYILN